MEIRKVQSTGGSSYVITLPKEWITSLNIKKNDPLGLIMQANGTLLVTPQVVGEEAQREKEVDMSSINEETYLFRLLIGAYIMGYDSIKITSKERLPPFVRGVIRRFTSTTIGQEIVEETDTYVILKDLLDPTEMPFDRTIKRMYIIIKGMHEDAFRLLDSKERNNANDIILRDNDVDRLHWLVARQHNIILRNASLAEKMSITIGMASTCFLISRIMERIGDHVVRIVQNSDPLLDPEINPEIITKMHTASNLALDIFNKSINSFFRRDLNAANENIQSVKKLESLCEEINTLALHQEAAIALSVGYIVESIRRIGEYAEDISETVINHLVGED